MMRCGVTKETFLVNKISESYKRSVNAFSTPRKICEKKIRTKQSSNFVLSPEGLNSLRKHIKRH